jgi:hypothetical protein
LPCAESQEEDGEESSSPDSDTSCLTPTVLHDASATLTSGNDSPYLLDPARHLSFQPLSFTYPPEMTSNSTYPPTALSPCSPPTLSGFPPPVASASYYPVYSPPQTIPAVLAEDFYYESIGGGGGGGEDMSFAEAFSALSNYVPAEEAGGPPDGHSFQTHHHQQQQQQQEYQQQLYLQVFNSTVLNGSHSSGSGSSGISITETFHELNGGGAPAHSGSYSDFFYPPSSHSNFATLATSSSSGSSGGEGEGVDQDPAGVAEEAAHHHHYLDKGLTL